MNYEESLVFSIAYSVVVIFTVSCLIHGVIADYRRNKPIRWEYGSLPSGTYARRDPKSGRVEVVGPWCVGGKLPDNPRDVDDYYWFTLDSACWENFIPEEV